jgi:hypothetical protein
LEDGSALSAQRQVRVSGYVEAFQQFCGKFAGQRWRPESFVSGAYVSTGIAIAAIRLSWSVIKVTDADAAYRAEWS